jgi:hypothetical protein
MNHRIFSQGTSLLTLMMAVVVLSSCNKLLDLTSPNEVGDDDLFNSVDGLRNARIGLYNTMQSRDYYGAYFPLIAEAYSDNGTTGGYDVIDLNEIADLSLTPSNIFITQGYNAIYNVIYTANKIIENIDNVPDLDEAEKSMILGEALFIRGLAHFDLLRFWGEHWDKGSAYGISIVISTVNGQQPVPRSTVEESYVQIMDDLHTAEELITEDIGNQFISPAAVQGLLARVHLYHGDMEEAADYATEVINSGMYALLPLGEAGKIYTDRLTSESVFELKFEAQNQSFYNAATYLREDALRPDILFMVSSDLNRFFEERPGDTRATLVDFENNDVSIEPDGRSQKYRGEIAKDNSAFVLRLAEIHLIRAEALGLENGLDDLNTLREARGLPTLSIEDFTDDEAYLLAILDERRAELNFEGHRLFDLARTGKVSDYMGESVNPIMPIPQREIAATGGVVEQNPGY